MKQEMENDSRFARGKIMLKFISFKALPTRSGLGYEEN